MLRDLIGLFFPPTCPGCGETIRRGEEVVCLGCLTELEETRFHKEPQDNELYFRLAGRVPLDGAAALFYFDRRGRFKRMIQALKYGNQPQVGQYLGKLYGEMLNDWTELGQVQSLIPVPLHYTRLMERGYNQSEEIARGLSKSLGIPVMSKALVRKQGTATQTKKSKVERWENVQTVFAMARPISGHIALVDDVITTGATLEACIKVLMGQPEPPASIRILALGMARHY